MGIDTDISISISVLETVYAAINAGGPAYTSTTGVNYVADNYFTAGNTFSVANPISGTADDTIYQSERWNPGFGYNIPLAPGDYRLVLMFAEIFDQIEAEERFFDVKLEGVEIIDRYDIFVQSGGLFTAIDLEFDFTLADSNVDIDFIVDLENPKISGIRIVEPYPLPYTTVITSPDHNQSFPTGKSINFEASGEGTATWTSDVDGLIGSGTSLDFSGLTEGSHTITLEMTAPSTEQRQVTIDLDIVEPYAFWRDQQTWGGGDDTKTGDPDSDLVENDLERIFGMNPVVYDRHLLPFSNRMEIESTDYFTYTYRKNLDVTDLDYWLDSTTELELNNWSPETLTPSNHELMDEEGSIQTYRFRHPVSSDPKRFFRLRVE